MIDVHAKEGARDSHYGGLECDWAGRGRGKFRVVQKNSPRARGVNQKKSGRVRRHEAARFDARPELSDLRGLRGIRRVGSTLLSQTE